MVSVGTIRVIFARRLNVLKVGTKRAPLSHGCENTPRLLPVVTATPLQVKEALRGSEERAIMLEELSQGLKRASQMPQQEQGANEAEMTYYVSSPPPPSFSPLPQNAE